MVVKGILVSSLWMALTILPIFLAPEDLNMEYVLSLCANLC